VKLHDDPIGRPARVFGGTVTPHFGPERASGERLPVIPAAQLPLFADR
jgi:hypothetical protein